MTRPILALTRYGRLGASSRVRMLQYIPELERAGFSVDVHPLFSDTDLLRLYDEGRRPAGQIFAAFRERLAAVRQSDRTSTIWLQQEIFPYLPFSVEQSLLAGRRLVVDFDDAHHLYYRDRLLARPFLGSKIERLMRRADVVIVGSPAMRETARSAGSTNVRLIHSAVDTATFPSEPPPPARFTVGWIGTPMTARQSLNVLRESLTRFLAETNAECVFVGMSKSQFPDLPGRRITWSEAAEREILPQLSVGLCPLEDSPWTRGKSGYKIIQYMAAGKATLASPVGIAADIVEDGFTGFHCRSSDDWYLRLRQLYSDAELTARLGANGRRQAQSRYDSSIAAGQLTEIFEDCFA